MANLATILNARSQLWRPKPGHECNSLVVWPFHYGDGETEPLVYACQDTRTGECFNLHRTNLRQMWEPANDA